MEDAWPYLVLKYTLVCAARRWTIEIIHKVKLLLNTWAAKFFDQNNDYCQAVSSVFTWFPKAPCTLIRPYVMDRVPVMADSRLVFHAEKKKSTRETETETYGP